MVERYHFDTNSFLRYKLGQAYPEYQRNLRATHSFPEFQRAVQNSIGASQDRLPVDEKKVLARGDTHFRQHVSTSMHIASVSAGLWTSKLGFDPLPDSQLTHELRQSHKRIFNSAHELHLPSRVSAQELHMDDIARRLMPYLQLGIIAHNLDKGQTGEGLRYLSHFDLAVSYLWGSNGDANRKVMLAYETPEYDWLIMQHDRFVQKGIITT